MLPTVQGRRDAASLRCLCFVSSLLRVALTFGLQEVFEARMDGNRLQKMTLMTWMMIGVRSEDDQKVRGVAWQRAVWLWPERMLQWCGCLARACAC